MIIKLKDTMTPQQLLNWLLEQKIIGSKVHYWEGWSGYPDGNIIDFMEQNIQTSDFFVPVCTQAWRESINCKKEKDLALP